MLIFTLILIKIINIILFPFSLTYGFILYIRNKFYDWNIFKSTTFNFPVIAIGNLSLGGTGKSPHIEYLVRLLQNEFKVATLSRGYKRASAGFYLAQDDSTVSDIGDEPLQYKLKFKNIPVAVDEKRVNGIEQLKIIYPDTNVILLDDAYQHRSVKPGLNILITDSSKLYINDNVIPSGRLREWACGSNRADIIVVSKTKSDLSAIEKNDIREILKLKPHQKIYFSYIKYGELTPYTIAAKNLDILDVGSVLLLTGIAKADPLLQKLKTEYKSVGHLKFPDHHDYKAADIAKIKNRYNSLPAKKIIITTEKDIMRLSLPEILTHIQDTPIFYIPIEICFHGNDKVEFDTQVLKYVEENSKRT